MGVCISKKHKGAGAAGSASDPQAAHLDNRQEDPENPGVADAPKQTDNDRSPSPETEKPIFVNEEEQRQPEDVSGAGQPAVRDFGERRDSLEITPAPPLGSKTY